MVGRKKGSRNKTQNPKVYTGDPYVNLALAVLKQAMIDERTEYADSMWSEFLETETYRMGMNKLDVFGLACGIASYIAK